MSGGRCPRANMGGTDVLRAAVSMGIPMVFPMDMGVGTAMNPLGSVCSAIFIHHAR